MARKSNLNTSLNDVKFHSVSIIPKNGKPISIAALWNVINLHESIFRPVITGNIQLNDTVNLRASFQFQGEERLFLSFSKPTNNGTLKYTKTFLIVRIDGFRKNDKGSGSSYTLRFCSEELWKSNKSLKINRAFEGGSYSDYVRNICENELQLNTDISIEDAKRKYVQLEQSYGPPKKHVISNYTPFEAIEYFEGRAVNEINSPFLFFENNQGFNFLSLSKMSDGISLVPGGLTVSSAKNSEDQSTFVPVRFNEIQNFNIQAVNDFLKLQKNLKGTVGAFDILRGSYNEFTTSSDNIDSGNLTNKDSVLPASKVEQAAPRIAYCVYGRANMPYVSDSFATSRLNAGQNVSPYSLDVADYRENDSGEERFLIQRRMLLNSLEFTMFDSCEVAGNPIFTAGVPVDINMPAFTPNDKLKRNIDPYMTGRYIITKVRHNLTKSTGLRTFIALGSNSPGVPLI